ncbi:DNA-binding protein HU |uniref:DNA-binding protein HU \
MTKAQFVAIVAQKSALSQKDTNIVIDSAIETIVELLRDDDHISFVDFGSFSTVKKAARDVRIPSTGEIVKVKAKRAVRFRAGKALKEAVI